MDKRAFMWLQQPGGGGMVILVRTGSPAANFLRGPLASVSSPLSRSLPPHCNSPFPHAYASPRAERPRRHGDAQVDYVKSKGGKEGRERSACVQCDAQRRNFRAPPIQHRQAAQTSSTTCSLTGHPFVRRLRSACCAPLARTGRSRLASASCTTENHPWTREIWSGYSHLSNKGSRRTS